MNIKTLLRLLPMLQPVVAMAHPMGNFSVNHYAKIEPRAQSIDIEYVLDIAEIPTLQLQQAWGVTAATPAVQLQQKAQAQAKAWTRNLDLRVDARRVSPEVLSTHLVVVDGAGGLPVYRVTTRLRVPATGGKFTYADHNFSERAGWREIVIATGVGAKVRKASQSNKDLSQALTAYPQDPTLAPPQDVHASLEWTGAPATEPTAPAPAAPAPARAMVAAQAPKPVASTPLQTNSLGNLSRSGFLSRTLANRNAPIGLTLGLTCMLVAFGLGALHAVEPGHGKTMVAAYLVGSHGTPKHAVVLGAMVTFTHTVSVFLLGFITLFLAQYIMPETLTKYLGIISGLSIVWIGGLLVYRRWRTFSAERPHAHDHAHHHHHHDAASVANLAHAHGHDHEAAPSHSHDHHHPHTGDHSHAHTPDGHTHDGHMHTHDGHTHDGHAHTHDAHTHTHDGHTHTHALPAELTMGSLLALGASGGMVPCPAALVLLLSCISLGRPALGIILLLAFSLGLALVLMAIGLAVLGAKSLVPAARRPSASSPWMRMLPVASALVILLVGVVMTGAALGVIPTIRFLG